MTKVGIISLGCARNLCDSEVIAGSLKKDGFEISDIAMGAQVCIINTCAFVKSAREESVEAILEASRLKKTGKIKYLIVCGCLSQLHEKAVAKALPEVDLIVGTSDFPKIPRLLKKLRSGARTMEVSADMEYLYDENSPRFLMTPRHYAYVKISEGCSNSCSYCIISRLRGAFRSRSIRSVVNEVKRLSRGAFLKEVNLIGQDTTLFGIDRYARQSLGTLLERLSRLSRGSVEWIRVLYTHPAHYTDELISVIRDEEKVCKYLDLPIQHISDRILRQMNRRVTKKDIILLIEKLRKNIPALVLRTSAIVGFPGETDEEFEELLDFLRQTRFERCGCFTYSRETGTRAAKMDAQVPEHVKKARFDRLMKLQQDVSRDINRSFIGKTVKVLIDEKTPGEKNKFIGRTQGDAPEVDGVVYVSGKNMKIGAFCGVRITDTLEYDLVGERV